MLYRFRACNEFLFDELEKNYIYFSDINDFNDYGENQINLVFQGDLIAWRGFLKHYISSLFLTLCFGNFENDSKIFINIEDYDSKYCTYSLEGKETLKNLSFEFLEDEFVRYFLNVITNKKISQRKLFLIISYLHGRALMLVFRSKNKDEINKLAPFKVFKENLDRIIDLNDTEELNRMIFQQEAIELLPWLKNLKDRKLSIIVDFPQKYLEQSKKMLYSDKYVACFSEEFSNNTMWGYYSNSFSGICLEFNTLQNNNKKYIEFYTRIGVNNNKSVFDWEKFYFKQVAYGNNEETFPEVNFFENLGRIPNHCRSIFLSENNKNSQYLQNNDEWKLKYWKLFDRLSTHKLLEWKHEKEWRLITDNTFFSFDNIEDRKLKYKFASLNGIIFGNRITKKDKDKIIEITAQNCIEEKRQEFNFYKLLYLNGVLQKQICIYSTLRLKEILNNKLKYCIKEE